jgi:thiopeptide-type bacteriocin biosynthesis protein
MPDTLVPPRSQREWVGVHVFHRGDLDAVLVEAVGPLVDELSSAGALGSWFFLRYWEGGPHLRVRLRPAAPEHAEDVSARVVERCARHLRSRPAGPAPTDVIEAYRELAARWARAEHLAEYDDRVRAVDSVELVPYRPESAVYGERAALAAAEAHFAESSALALRLLRGGLPMDRRRAVALAALMLAVAVCEPRAADAARRLPRPDGVTATPRLREQARRFWAAANADAGTGLGGELATWLRSVRALHETLATGARNGSFAPSETASPLGHLAACAAPATRPAAAVVLRCTHLLFNRLGVHGAAEVQIAGMAAAALNGLDEEE